MALEPRVRKVAPVHRCDRCAVSEDTLKEPERLHITGSGVRYCPSCIRILVRVATI